MKILKMIFIIVSLMGISNGYAGENREENRRLQNQNINATLQDPDYKRSDSLEIRVLSKEEISEDEKNEAPPLSRPLSRYIHKGTTRKQYFVGSVEVDYGQFSPVSREYIVGMLQYRQSMLKLGNMLSNFLIKGDDINFNQLQQELEFCREHIEDDVLSFSDMYDYRLKVFEAADKVINKETIEGMKEDVRKGLLIELALFNLDFPRDMQKDKYVFKHAHLFGKESLEAIFTLIDKADKEAPLSEDNFYVVELFKDRITEVLPEIMEDIKEIKSLEGYDE